MSTARFGLRATQALRQPLRQNIRSTVQRRYQSTAEQVAQDAAKEETAFSKFFNSPVGPKTVHFWAPIMKVCLTSRSPDTPTYPAQTAY